MTNSKSTKRALVSSALAVFLCVAMLIGTTFAWFTDTASTSVNKIQAGKLDVALEVKENGKWVSAEGKTLDFVKAKGHENEAILWEPGCTYNLPELRIVNNGNLALKYKVVITGIKGDAKLNEVIDWTIDDVAQGTEQKLAAGANNEFTISGTMKTTAGNAYQGLYIDGISITVYATQDTVEYDSNDNQYDKDAALPSFWDGKSETPITSTEEDGKYHIKSAAELIWLMNNTQDSNSPYSGKTFVLDQDINLGGYTVKGLGSEQCNWVANFDGNNYAIKNFKIERSGKEYYAGLFNYVMGSTISNLTVENATISGDAMVGAIVGSIDTNGKVVKCTVNNGTVIGEEKVGGAVGYASNATIEDVFVKDTAIYVENTDAAQSGKVVGFQNPATVTNISDENVTIIFMARVNTLDALNDAVNNAKISKIVLTDDITNPTVPTIGDASVHQPTDTYSIEKGRNLTVDFNGYILTTPVRLFNIKGGATLTLENSDISGKQSGIYFNKVDSDSNYGKNAYGIYVTHNGGSDGEYGILNIEKNVTLGMGIENAAAQPQGMIWNCGKVNMNGGELIAYGTAAVYIFSSPEGDFIMNDGKITLGDSNATGIHCSWNGNADIKLIKGSLKGKGLSYKIDSIPAYNIGVNEVKVSNNFVIDTAKGPQS